MDGSELVTRITLLEHLWHSIGREPSDALLRALAIQTTRIPLCWFVRGVEEIASIWEPGPKVPTMRTLFDASRRAAGFVARYTRTSYIDPTPSTVRWWPPPGRVLDRDYGERWGEDPRRIDIPGKYLVATPALADHTERELTKLGKEILREIPEKTDAHRE